MSTRAMTSSASTTSAGTSRSSIGDLLCGPQFAIQNRRDTSVQRRDDPTGQFAPQIRGVHALSAKRVGGEDARCVRVDECQMGGAADLEWSVVAAEATDLGGLPREHSRD